MVLQQFVIETEQLKSKQQRQKYPVFNPSHGSSSKYAASYISHNATTAVTGKWQHLSISSSHIQIRP